MNKTVFALLGSFLLASIGLSSCGKRGDLEVPPPKEEQQSSLEQMGSQNPLT